MYKFGYCGSQLVDRVHGLFKRRETYTWRILKALCVLLILLIKAFVLQKEAQRDRSVSGLELPEHKLGISPY